MGTINTVPRLILCSAKTDANEGSYTDTWTAVWWVLIGSVPDSSRMVWSKSSKDWFVLKLLNDVSLTAQIMQGWIGMRPWKSWNGRNMKGNDGGLFKVVFKNLPGDRQTSGTTSPFPPPREPKMGDVFHVVLPVFSLVWSLEYNQTPITFLINFTIICLQESCFGCKAVSFYNVVKINSTSTLLRKFTGTN